MIQKFVSILSLAAVCLLSPRHVLAATPDHHERPSAETSGAQATATATGASEGDAVGDKFRKLQHEMEGAASATGAAVSSGSASNRTSARGDASTKTPAADTAHPSESIGIATLAFQILMGLIFVLILAVVTIRLLKKLQGSMLSKGGKPGGDLFELLETCHLGTNQKVVALRMNEEVGILGVTPQGITLLTILKEPAAEIRQARAQEGNSAAFSDNLNKLLDRFKKPKRVSDLLDEAQG